MLPILWPIYETINLLAQNDCVASLAAVEKDTPTRVSAETISGSTSPRRCKYMPFFQTYDSHFMISHKHNQFRSLGRYHVLTSSCTSISAPYLFVSLFHLRIQSPDFVSKLRSGEYVFIGEILPISDKTNKGQVFTPDGLTLDKMLKYANTRSQYFTMYRPEVVYEVDDGKSSNRGGKGASKGKAIPSPANTPPVLPPPTEEGEITILVNFDPFSWPYLWHGGRHKSHKHAFLCTLLQRGQNIVRTKSSNASNRSSMSINSNGNRSTLASDATNVSVVGKSELIEGDMPADSLFDIAANIPYHPIGASSSGFI